MQRNSQREHRVPMQDQAPAVEIAPSISECDIEHRLYSQFDDPGFAMCLADSKGICRDVSSTRRDKNTL